MPLTGPMLQGTLPFYPPLTLVQDNEQGPYIAQPMPLDQQGTRHPLVYQPAPFTDTQVAHARLHKAGHRPLGSTFNYFILFHLQYNRKYYINNINKINNTIK